MTPETFLAGRCGSDTGGLRSELLRDALLGSARVAENGCGSQSPLRCNTAVRRSPFSVRGTQFHFGVPQT